MRKPIIFILLALALSSSCLANYTLRFNDYSFHIGKHYRFNQNPMYSFDLQYDRFYKSCLKNKKYFGIGSNCFFNEAHKEIGIKALWNPTQVFINNHQSIKFIPYIFIEGILILKNIPTEPILTKSNNKILRPGLGITNIFCKHLPFNIRTSVQLGYNSTQKHIFELKKPLSLDFKIGIAINPTKFKDIF